MRHGSTLIVALASICAALVGIAVLNTDLGHATLRYAWSRLDRVYTIEERLQQHSVAVEKRMKRRFAAAGLPYPPPELAYVAIKAHHELEVYARASPADGWTFVRAYPILGQSGRLGPKLREGDRQVPEGIYVAESLNPNSRYHLSIRVNYPNAFDRAAAAAEGRTRLGSDIMIHGTSYSIGCLAVGNSAAEDLFVLAALASARVRILISPVDFRIPDTRAPKTDKEWVTELYGLLAAELAQYPPRR